jgi:hypothetical protein
LGLELAYLEQVEAEGLDLSQDAVQRGLVQEPGEHGVRAVPPARARSRHVVPLPAGPEMFVASSPRDPQLREGHPVDQPG